MKNIVLNLMIKLLLLDFTTNNVNGQIDWSLE